MKKIIVLGAGLVGRPMLLDLLNEPGIDLAIADISEKKINEIVKRYKVKGIVADLSDETQLRTLLSDFDIAVNAVPGFMGFATLKTVLETGKDVVDIAFSPEDLNELNQIAINNNVTALVDFGVAPGLSHLTVGYLAEVFDHLDKVRIFVGGLPKRRSKPFEYSAVFSPIDVIEEYTRPARLVENGKAVVKEALTEIESLEFDGIGTLEAFNSDGLRSLVHSIKAEDMAEKTLRYPGHAQLMKSLRDIGFFNQDKLKINDIEVSPLELTAELIFPQWEMLSSDRDMTVMKITAAGSINGQKHSFDFNLYDEFDDETMIHSMARTTGYTATMGVRLLLNGLFSDKGVFYPEELGKDKKILDFIIQGLKDRGIKIKQEMIQT